MKLIENNLSGSEIVTRLRRGHVVRRECWVDGVYVRICNEDGFDENGYAITDGKHTTIYTHSTRGYFLHIGSSSQPFRKPYVFGHKGQATVAERDGEGFAMLFADDWEDYGFMEGSEFNKLTRETKDQVRENVRVTREKAKTKFKKEFTDE